MCFSERKSERDCESVTLCLHNCIIIIFILIILFFPLACFCLAYSMNSGYSHLCPVKLCNLIPTHVQQWGYNHSIPAHIQRCDTFYICPCAMMVIQSFYTCPHTMMVIQSFYTCPHTMMVIQSFYTCPQYSDEPHGDTIILYLPTYTDGDTIIHLTWISNQQQVQLPTHPGPVIIHSLDTESQEEANIKLNSRWLCL